MEMSDVKQSGWAIASVAVLVINLIQLTLLTIMTAITRLKIAQVYQDMGVTLPQITKEFIKQPCTVYIGLIGILATGLLAKEIIMRRKKSAFMINMMGLAAGAGFWLLFVLAIFAPMIKIAESLGNTH